MYGYFLDLLFKGGFKCVFGLCYGVVVFLRKWLGIVWGGLVYCWGVLGMDGFVGVFVFCFGGLICLRWRLLFCLLLGGSFDCGWGLVRDGFRCGSFDCCWKMVFKIIDCCVFLLWLLMFGLL